LAPFHRAAHKKPFYAAFRYAFHACLFIVPIWFSGHVYLWEESRFEWYWTPLPDVWADRMTLAVLGACVIFLIRRLVFARRLEAGISDFVLILITAMPFLSGYFLTHGTLGDIDFFDQYLWYVHVISAEIMLLMIVVLFCQTRLSRKTCVGCAACVENCPTQTLAFDDRGRKRSFNYSHYQCICCGSCVNVCPEKAASLRHDLNPANLIGVLAKTEIISMELQRCQICGVFLAPISQLDKLQHSIDAGETEISTLRYCRRCKNLRSGMQTAKQEWADI
jgi:formate hydrogenlyase subunit 6/NADH:ubiquinone oxidoreductase subunit I